jgi:hypothetical protein
METRVYTETSSLFPKGILLIFWKFCNKGRHLLFGILC